MEDNSNRGELARDSADSYSNRQDTKPPDGVVPKDDIEFTAENPNIAKAVAPATNETAGVTTQTVGTYPDVIPGSDSERTGTSWGLPAQASGQDVATPEGLMPEGEGEDEAHPTRNTGNRLAHDDLDEVGAWKTMDTLD